MYFLTTEHSFDAAHFLSGYEGKCSHIHGHRWRVIVEIKDSQLQSEQQTRGMVVDFGDFKKDVKEAIDYFDHSLIYEKDTLKSKTVEALHEEGFKLIEVMFRPTAENFAKYFHDFMSHIGYNVSKVTVYETPTNCAAYTKED